MGWNRRCVEHRLCGAPLQPYGAAVVLCAKEVLGDYVGSPVMIPSAPRRGRYCDKEPIIQRRSIPAAASQLTGVPAATYSRALALSTRTDRHVVPWYD